jgi:RhtB (resistance to homoserine/threonine) family protein
MGVHLWAFVPIAAAVIITPGPDTLLVTKNAVLHGRAAALATSLGVNTGLLVWTIAAAVGVAAIVRESSLAFDVLKIAGAAYLIWLGTHALLRARQRAAVAGARARGGSRIGPARGYRQGLLSNLGNPKIAVFFTGLLPQFVAPGRSAFEPLLLLGCLFVAMTLVWLCGYALVAARATRLLSRPRVARAIDSATGLVLVGFGVRLALERP